VGDVGNESVSVWNVKRDGDGENLVNSGIQPAFHNGTGFSAFVLVGKRFSTEPDIWMNTQNDYELRIAARKLDKAARNPS
jgi:hypothetical protein